LRAGGSRKSGLSKTREGGGQSCQEGDEAGGVHVRYYDEGVVWKELCQELSIAAREWMMISDKTPVCWLDDWYILYTETNPIQPSITDHNAQPASVSPRLHTTTDILLEHWHHTYPRRNPLHRSEETLQKAMLWISVREHQLETTIKQRTSMSLAEKKEKAVSFSGSAGGRNKGSCSIYETRQDVEMQRVDRRLRGRARVVKHLLRHP
jgi:hypothetical protein